MNEITMTPQEHVEKMLKEYGQNKRIMAANEKAIDMFIPVTEQEVIEMMSFGQAVGERVQNTNISQRVAKIACAYKRVTRAMNREALRSMMIEFQKAYTEVAFVDYAVEHMPRSLHDLAVDFCDETLSWSEICQKHQLPNTTLARRKRKITETIVLMYDEKYSMFCLSFE